MNTTVENQLIFQNDYLKVEKKSNAIICTAKSNYIPSATFKETFIKIGELVKTEGIKKIIFDKRNLTVFDQSAMTWYHVEWKYEMLSYGLKSYRKLLPQDKFFRTSVQIGRKKITDENPTFKFEDFDIQYVETLEEAMNE